MSISINELENKAMSLMENIKNVDNDIKKITGTEYVPMGLKSRKRMFDDRKPSLNQSFNEDKKPKITPIKFDQNTSNPPSVASKVVGDAKIVSSTDESNSTTAPPKTITPQEKNRSIRIFGHLMKTLTEFKIKSESDVKQNNLRDQIVENAVKHEKENDIKIKEERQNLIKLRTAKQRELIRVRQQIHFKELEDKWSRYTDKLKSFIQTKTEPKIFYLPSKLDEKSKLLLTESQSLLDKQLKERIQLLFSSKKYADDSIIETDDEHSNVDHSTVDHFTDVGHSTDVDQSTLDHSIVDHSTNVDQSTIINEEDNENLNDSTKNQDLTKSNNQSSTETTPVRNKNCVSNVSDDDSRPPESEIVKKDASNEGNKKSLSKKEKKLTTVNTSEDTSKPNEKVTQTENSSKRRSTRGRPSSSAVKNTPNKTSNK